MNENQVRRILGDVAEQVPDTAAPVSQVTRRGRQVEVRRRARRRVGALVAVTALVAGGGATVLPRVVGGDDSAQVTAQDSQSEEHSYQSGGSPPHQVALGRVVVTVPGSWTGDQPEGCVEVPAGGLAVSDLRVDCTTPEGDLPRTVQIASASELGEPGETPALVEVDQNGLTVLVQPQCGPTGNGACTRLALVPSEGLAVQVSGGPDAQDQMDAVLDSIALLEEGEFAVPPGLVGQRADPIIEELTRLGADLGISRVGAQRDGLVVTEVDPASGTVLTKGEQVLVATGPSITSPPDVDLQGTWTITLAGPPGTGGAEPPSAQPPGTAGEAPPSDQPLVGTTITFDKGTVDIGRCVTWRGDYTTASDEIRFSNLAEASIGRLCDDGADEVARTLAEVEHVTGRGDQRRLHLGSYEIVATLRR